MFLHRHLRKPANGKHFEFPNTRIQIKKLWKRCCDEQLIIIRNLFISGIRKSGCKAEMNSRSAISHKILPSGTENANVEAKKTAYSAGIAMEFWPGNDRTGCWFFFNKSKNFGSKHAMTRQRIGGSGQIFVVFFSFLGYHGVEAKCPR